MRIEGEWEGSIRKLATISNTRIHLILKYEEA